MPHGAAAPHRVRSMRGQSSRATIQHIDDGIPVRPLVVQNDCSFLSMAYHQIARISVLLPVKHCSSDIVQSHHD